MLSNISLNLDLVSLSIFLIAFSRVSTDFDKSSYWLSRYCFLSCCSCNSSIAARLMAPRLSILTFILSINFSNSSTFSFESIDIIDFSISAKGISVFSFNESRWAVFSPDVIFRDQMWLLGYVDLLASFKKDYVDPPQRVGGWYGDGASSSDYKKQSANRRCLIRYPLIVRTKKEMQTRLFF